jgi:hypothetical protein
VAAKPASGTAAPLSKVMASGVAQMQRHDIAVKADNFTREVIYPSLYRPASRRRMSSCCNVRRVTWARRRPRASSTGARRHHRALQGAQ